MSYKSSKATYAKPARSMEDAGRIQVGRGLGTVNTIGTAAVGAGSWKRGLRRTIAELGLNAVRRGCVHGP